MASSVFFKFKSQKEPQRVTFDGTEISVFELKREIINISRLGDGTDFDLLIFDESTNEEYDDDTSLIARSSTVVARRLPAIKPGQGRAARYVSGRMPLASKSSSAAKPAASSTASVSNAQTEEEKIAAMMRADGEQWEQQKQQMANATPVYRPGGAKSKAASVPDHDPPPGYVCYRCGEKGHWIQACPTNNDRNYDGRPRIKRTTGIPRSFLQTIEKPTALTNEGSGPETKVPSGVMVNAEGDYVVAVPDKAAWDQYQAKAQASAAREDKTASGNKAIQERGLECPIDKRLFNDPVKTPCCSKTYCHDCIENALVNNDLVCPSCSTEGVLLDNLEPDQDAVAKIKEYEDEKKRGLFKPAETATTQPTEPEKPNSAKDESTPQDSMSKSASPEPDSSTPTPTNKRKADEELAAASMLKAQKMERTESKESSTSAESKTADAPVVNPMASFDKAFEQMKQGANNMGMSNGGFPVGMMGPMGPINTAMVNPGMMNPMATMSNMNMNMNMNQWGMGFQPWMMAGMNPMNPMMFGAGFNAPNGQQFGNSQSANFQGGPARSNGISSNQNFTNTDNNDAYMRKPVNPHRHQGRNRKVRPTDYREL